MPGTLEEVRGACAADAECIGFSFKSSSAPCATCHNACRPGDEACRSACDSNTCVGVGSGSVIYSSVDCERGCGNLAWQGDGRALIAGTSGNAGYTCWVKGQADQQTGICV